jgi:aryl-alcohol dehydrogenase-like predicted oxidoreductase
MQHVRFGRTGLKVSRLCLGTMTFGYQCDAETSIAILDAAAESGITFLDTADVYPLGGPPELVGRTEEIIGQWLAPRRDQFILATKCHYPTGPMPWDSGNSRQNIMRALEASLRRLRTDHIDLYQLHSWDPNTPIDETLQALDDVVRAGKVRYVGCSNFLAYQLARSVGRAEVLGTSNFISVQPRYNLLYREHERELFPLCEEEGIAVIPYNPLAGGFLSGKHQPGSPTEGGRFTLGAAAGRYQERYWHDRMFSTVDELRPIAAEAGVSMATLAMQWVLANPVITSPIVGASRAEQLVDSVAAVEAALDSDVKDRLDQMTAEFR